MTDTSATEEMITPALVRLDVTLGSDKTEVIRALAAQVASAGRTQDADQLAADALAREATAATGLPGGIAIPHCRTEAVSVPTLAFARLSPPVDFGAKSGPADLAFLIAAPAGGDATHLKVLTQLARALVKKGFTDGLREAASPEEVVTLVNEVVTLPAATAPKPASGAPRPTQPDEAPAEATPTAPAPGATAAPAVRRSLVAVTACPTGIAHTYMAAEALEAAAGRAGIDIAVETQGSAGSNPLPRETIANASAAIFAVDVGVRDRSRFAGLPLVASGVKRPMEEADEMIAEALRFADDPNAPRVEGSSGDGASGSGTAATSTGGESWGLRTRRVLMTGVSYMIPFVAAGGLLIALGFLFGGYELALDGNKATTSIMTNNSLFNLPDVTALGLQHALFGSNFLAYLGAVMFTIGGLAFGFLVPALAGYIAYAIADRPGIAPGFVMGAVALAINAGFLGGIVGGVLAGVIAHWLAQRKVPPFVRSLMPVVIIPLGTSLVAGLIMFIVLAKPLSKLQSALTDGLNNMNGGSAVLLGVVLGLMMAFDMGGPLNKTAYLFATTGLGAAAASTNAPQLKIMAAVMLSGMVPPLALALATVVRPKIFTPAERENGKAAWLLGASFITEGAIPFAASDPLRVIPAVMLGSAVTGGLSEALHVGLRAPHGGIFVLFAVIHVLGFLIALVAGVLVATGAVVALKSRTESNEEIEALSSVSV